MNKKQIEENLGCLWITLINCKVENGNLVYGDLLNTSTNLISALKSFNEYKEIFETRKILNPNETICICKASDIDNTAVVLDINGDYTNVEYESLEEIESKYNNNFVFMNKCLFDLKGNLTGGNVVFYSKNEKEVINVIRNSKIINSYGDIGFRFVGENTLEDMPKNIDEIMKTAVGEVVDMFDLEGDLKNKSSKRIEPFLELLKAYWKLNNNSQLRFMQMMEALDHKLRERYDISDSFYLEDDEVYTFMETELKNQLRTKNEIDVSLVQKELKELNEISKIEDLMNLINKK